MTNHEHTWYHNLTLQFPAIHYRYTIQTVIRRHRIATQWRWVA